jgi:hypothetical protein|tara:strand:+ start:237 stop:383 length:147 start_codon:yes stop_codon:yes gene_type:complete
MENIKTYFKRLLLGLAIAYVTILSDKKLHVVEKELVSDYIDDDFHMFI